MKITWIGHSCFAIEKDGYTLVIDPYKDGSVPGLLPVRETADRVLCSHEHGDHNFREGVTIRESGGAPLTVEELDTYHDQEQGTLRGSNKMFLISDGVCRIAHLGDLGCRPDQEQKDLLAGVDVVLIPVGGYYTIDGKQAADLIREIQPRAVIPMHFRSDRPGFGFAEIGTVDGFLSALGKECRTETDWVDTDEMGEEQVWVLRPKNFIPQE